MREVGFLQGREKRPSGARWVYRMAQDRRAPSSLRETISRFGKSSPEGWRRNPARPSPRSLSLAVTRRPIATESIGSAPTHPSLRRALATKPSRGHSMCGAGSPDSRTAAPGWLRFADKKQAAKILMLQGSICNTRESGYPEATMRRRKAAPVVGVERVRPPGDVAFWSPAFAGMTRGESEVSSLRVGRRPERTRNDGKGIGSRISARRLIRHRGRPGWVDSDKIPLDCALRTRKRIRLT
jgi:hypothetical protein